MNKNLLKTMGFMLSLSMLASCSSDSGTTTNTGNTSSGADSSSAQTESSSTEGSTEESTGARTMNFYNGELELPEVFENFVVMDYSLVDNFISLGHAPTYGTSYTYAESMNYMYAQRMYDDFDLRDIEVLSTRSDTFFEELLMKAPSFIILSEGSATDLENYEAIAPTYIFPAITDVPEGSATWKENFKLVAEFLGEEEKGEQMLADYDTLVEESRATVADEIEGKTALVVQLNEVGFKLRMPSTQTSVYADIGFGIPEGLNEDYATTGNTDADGSFPVETIVYFNPDYIMIHNQSTENYNALVGTPIWENVTAVQNGDVYEIAQSSWNHTNGYSANTCRVKDLVMFIMDKEQAIPEYLSIG